MLGFRFILQHIGYLSCLFALFLPCLYGTNASAHIYTGANDRPQARINKGIADAPSEPRVNSGIAASALPERITDSAGRILALHFEALPQIAGESSPSGQSAPQKRLTRIDLIAGPGAWDAPPPIKLPPQPLVTYAYDEAGDLVSVRDRLGRICRQFEYRRHILTAHTLPGGVRVEYAYDRESPQGRVLSSHSSTGEHYDFDYRRNRTLVTDHLGRQQIFRFDRRREWTGHTDALGGRTGYALDADGRPLQRTNAAGGTLTYAYDRARRLTRLLNESCCQSPGGEVKCQRGSGLRCRWR